LNLIASTRAINSHVQLNDDKHLINYNKEIDIDICNKSCIDIGKISDILGDDEYNKEKSGYDNVSVAISAAITAYARMHMSKIKLDILNKGVAGSLLLAKHRNKIYYTDTDSIVTNIELNVDKTAIGALKLEHTIKESYFITNKTYCLVDSEGLIIKKDMLKELIKIS